MKAKLEHCFKGIINGVDFNNSNVYFAVESILKSIEKSGADIDTNSKKLTDRLYLAVMDKEYNTPPRDFEDWEYHLSQYIRNSKPENIEQILHIEFSPYL